SAYQLPGLCYRDCGRDVAAAAGGRDYRGAKPNSGSGRRHCGARPEDVGGEERHRPRSGATGCHGQQSAGRSVRPRGPPTGPECGHAAQLIMARKAFLLRIDPQVLSALERWAEEELRSVNGQIEYLLRQALAKRGMKLSAPKDERAGNEK